MGRRRAALLSETPGVEVVVGSRSATQADFPATIQVAAPDDALAAGVDAVVVSVVTSLHAEVVRAALALAVPIFVEKPLTLDVSEGVGLARLGEERGVAIQVGFHRRSDPAYREAAARVADGRLGRLYHLHSVAHDHELPPETFLEASGGIFRDLLVHDIDAARFLTGREVVEVYAVANNRAHPMFPEHGDVDTATLLLTMDDGLVVSASGCRHDPVGYDARTEIFGERDSLTIGLGERTPLRAVQASGEGGSAWSAGVLEPAGETSLHGPANPYAGFLDRFSTAFAAETSRFVELVAGTGENPCPPKDALAALVVAETAERSCAAGRPVPVPAEGEWYR